MNAEQVRLIQQSFNQVTPIADTAAQLFYDRLFEIDPGLKSMFPEDLTEQGEKLMAMLSTAVDGLDNLEQLQPELEALAIRHVDYGVKPADYAPVGEALIWTLARGWLRSYLEEMRTCAS